MPILTMRIYSPAGLTLPPESSFIRPVCDEVEARKVLAAELPYGDNEFTLKILQHWDNGERVFEVPYGEFYTSVYSYVK